MRYVSLNAPVKFIKLYHSYENAAMSVCTSVIPLIGKDGDDVIDDITCELTGTESINTQT